MMRYDDETLTAFADGRLDAAAAAEIERALETDEALAEHVAALMESGAAVKALYAPLAREPVPPALAERVAEMVAAAGAREAAAGDAAVLPFRSRRPAPAGFWQMAAAAAVAAFVAGPVGYLAGLGGAGPARDASAAVLAIGAPLPADLAGLLASVPAGEERAVGTDGRLRLIASFRDAGGSLCREFELDERDAVVAVACRAGLADWQVTFAVNAPIAEEGFAPASSLAALDAYLEAISAEAPMTPDEERDALAGASAPAP